MKNSKQALLRSVLTLLLCIVMLLGTTFAWFTDVVTSGSNRITSGNLDIEMYWTDDLDAGTWYNVEDKATEAVFDYDKWEPGYTEIRYIKVVNAGSLAFKYIMDVVPMGEVSDLAEVIDVYYLEDGEHIPARAVIDKLSPLTTLKGVIETGITSEKVLLPKGKTASGYDSGEAVFTVALKMREDAGNEYQNKSVGDSFTIALRATQYNFEYDSFGDDYDYGVEFPELELPVKITAAVPVDANGYVTEDTTVGGGQFSAVIPAGVKLESGVSDVTLSVTYVKNSKSNVTLEEDEVMTSLDVHIEGVSSDNTVPITVNLGKVMPIGLNSGSIALYHVENGTTNEMSRVAYADAFTAHNQYKYDAETGDISLYMATFSEVALTMNSENPWEGEVDTAWYNGNDTEFTVANADELAGLNKLVSEGDNFEGKTVKLMSDVNIGGTDNYDENGKSVVWYPIGYKKQGDGTNKAGETEWYTYGGEFSGVFDGNGHTVTGIYQNTWVMDGNYDNGYWNAAMGLFGYVYDGTVKNLTIDNFYSEGEFAPTGCVSAYAAGECTFENIAVTNSHPQTYNTGVAGIVGWDAGGDTEDEASKFTFKNITVDDKNTISALWGSWDVAAAGLLGYLGKYSTADLTNCNVAATIDVYNDVCGNYQYYWYRYCGMMIGTVDRKNSDGSLDLSNVTAENCTVNFGERHEYYYCEFEKNTQASYTEDYQFSRVDHSELDFSTDPVTCTHTHTANEDKQAVYIPFRQLFGGYGWGVDGVDLGEYKNIKISDITNAQDKFVTKFENSETYLYRVGNVNTVSVGSLFEAISDDINDSGVYVTVDKVDDNTNVSGEFTANTSDWTQGTIKFSGTGPVKVTIQDYDYCKPTVLYLEVVDATNVTDYSGLGNKNSVLLNDITMSSGSSYYLSGATLYGNGFMFDVSDGAYSGTGSVTNNYLVNLTNANLDNVQIVGAVYTSYGAQVANDYNRPTVLSVGNNTIANSYISNCASPVRVRDGNLEIVNTTLKGGNFANLDIRGGNVVLDNVTTINQVNGNDTAEDGTVVVGLGVVVYYENVLNSTTLEIKNGITQYNHLSKTQAETYIKDDTASTLVSAMFDDQYSTLQYSDGSDTWINTGIISMTDTVGDDNITDVDGYGEASPSLIGTTGYVHTKMPDAASIAATAPTYTGAGQGAIAPSYSFDYTTKNYQAKTDGSNDYCYEENGTVNISMDAGDTFNWDTSILTATKNGQTLDYTVSMNGTDYTGKSIAFNTAGNYKVVYTYKDANNYTVDENGDIGTYEKNYTKTVYISVAAIEASAKSAEFTMGSSNAATEKITVDNVTYISATGVTADNSTWTYMTVGDQKIYYPIIAAKLTSTEGSSSYAYFPVFENAVTITDYEDNGTGDAFTYNYSTTTLPSTLTAVKGVYKAAADVTSWSNLTNSNLTQSGASKIFKWASSSDAPSDPETYNNVLCYKSPQISAKRAAYITLVQYSYTDATNTTYYYYVGYKLEAFTYSPGCVTPDTLVTLADGSQARVDSLTGNEQLLVWNHTTGKLDTAPVAYIVDHEGVEDEREVIRLVFSDGRDIEIIGEHVFYDATLNKYVSLDTNADDYIGHSFIGLSDGNDAITSVKLVKVEKEVRKTKVYEIVSYEHLTCFTDGILSTSAYLDKLLNIFDIDTETLAYTAESVQADIEKYGLYTYDDFEGLIAEEAFEMYNAKYLKIAVGKGYITWEDILALIDIYFDVDVEPIQ